MSEMRKSRYEDETERDVADDGDVCESDRRFLESISENIKRDKDHLQCPDQGPDVHRYIIYSNAFDEVIQRATVYKGLLSAIKKEYDDAISVVKKSQYETRVAQRKRNAMEAQAPSLVNYHRQAAQLKDRIAIIQRDTAEVQSKLDKLQQSSGDKSSSSERKSADEAETRLPKQIPGLSLEQSLDLEALEGHLQCLESRRDMLQDRKKSQYVPLEVKQQLDSKLKAAQAQTHPLTSENDRLRLQYRRLKVVSDSLSRWKDSGRPVPLAELLTATLENISHISDSDCDGSHGTDCVLLEDEDPAKVKESKLLVDYVDSFTELFESGDYEAAAFHAARSPHGVLRNQHTVDKFKLVKEYDGRMPPFLHFFQALMVSCTQRERPLLGEVMVSCTQRERPLLGESLSVDGVRCALQHNVMELVIHGITLHKLAFSEALGDVLTERAQTHPGTADMCLTLAHAVYTACRLHRKAALSMCKRGMLHAALDYMYQCPHFTAEDSMWCLSMCPSLSLLQMLTTESLQHGQQAMLPVGLTCYSLLMDKQHHLLAVQLLDSLCSKGTGVLEQAMVSDSRGWVELWGEISTCCAELQRSDLSRHILSVLLAHTGTSRLSPDLDGLSLMDHVFL